MAKAAYIGAAGVGRKLKKMYVGVDIPREEYGTQLEYIESSGTQYIDTGYMPNQGTRVEAEYAYVSGDAAFFGARSGDTGYFAYVVSSDNVIRALYGTAWPNSNTAPGTAKSTVVMDGTAGTLTVGDSTVSMTAATFQIEYPMYLFGYNHTGTLTLSASIRIYSCKIYDNGTLVRDYVPCKLADGSIGMFDKVEYKFYANAGTGVFTAGAEVGAIAREARKNIARKVKKGYVGVKYVYTELEYIESTGTQYIDTGFVPNQDTRIDIRTMPMSVADGGFIPYGAATGYNSNAFECYTTGGQYEFNYDGQYDFVGTAATGHLLSITHDKNNVTVTNETNGSEWTLTLTYKEFTAPQKLVLCAINRGSITCGSQKLYSCRIYDNGTLIRDYVPCKDTSGAIGLYDKVAGKFYTNAGTGTFAAGAETGVQHTKSVAKLFYSGNTGIRFSGSSELLQYTIDGNVYNVMRIKGTGVLSISGDDPVPVFLVGGGSGGCTPSDSFPAPIGGSGGFVLFGKLAPADYNVLIGAGGAQNANGGDTVVTDTNGTEVLKAAGGNFNGPGGSGGGGAYDVLNRNTVAALKGSGDSTVPLGIVDLQPHSAGGAAGGTRYRNASGWVPYDGGDGGTNGGSGKATAKSSNANYGIGGTGGEKGGGDGGSNSNSTATTTPTAGKSATFYGSAGGAGAMSHYDNQTDDTITSAGRGYQGCMYLIWNEEGIPYDWEPLQIIVHPTGGTSPCLMTCEATGKGVTYQWQKYATLLGWSDISGATSNTYTGTAGTSFLSSSTRYRCKVTDASGAVFYSNEATVTKS